MTSSPWLTKTSARAVVLGICLTAATTGVAQQPPDWFDRANLVVPPVPPVSEGGTSAEAFADSPDDRLSDVQARLETLEAQNADLTRRLEAAESAAPREPESGEAEGDGWYEVGSDLGMTASWHNGVELESANKDFRFHVGGRVQFDGVWFDDAASLRTAGGAGDADAVDFRRARLRADGTMYEWIDWVAEFDFVNGTNDNVGLQGATAANVTHVPAPTDLWVNFKGLPYVGNLRVGNVKEPIGMEHLTSSRFLPFLERSFNQDVFYGQFNNGFTPGVMVFDTYADRYGTWATGVFKGTNNVFAFNADDGDYAWTSRLTYLPFYDECSDGRSLLHVAVSNSLRDPVGGNVRYRARPSLRNGPGPLNPVLADTGTFAAEAADFVGAEAAMNYGSFNLQAEWTGAFNAEATASGRPAGDVFVQGAYVQALYFLTGEHMTYDRAAGVFGRVVPRENAYVLKGLGRNVLTTGAWQVGARYAYLDESDEGVDGGLLHDWTFGLNWYLNPNMKLQGNYVVTLRDVPPARGASGWSDGFGMRLAYDF